MGRVRFNYETSGLYFGSFLHWRNNRWRWSEWRSYLSNFLYLLLPIFVIAGWQELPKFVLGSGTLGSTSYTAHEINFGGIENFKQFLIGYLKTHLTEMTVWYWGVFKWFGVIMPRFWWWIATRLLGLSVIGLFIKLYLDIRQKRFSFESKIIIFSVIANLIMLALGWLKAYC
jgi:hypothetical protein